ncbi:hypothetical protein [Okeania sp.]|uniref:hypothetical protein n=1 Tax=Okeania sp. TaxID=3100323 RepID=UPI002B4B8269|nr:hypothetical protein [Okeania sp.]MEB3343471.1 hypothetical protein [Okeania sp.]
MWKYILIALISLELVLLSAFIKVPANANIRDLEVFTWDYASINNSQIVCKKVKFQPANRKLPESSDMEPVKINSQIIDDSYCFDLTKPV